MSLDHGLATPAESTELRRDSWFTLFSEPHLNEPNQMNARVKLDCEWHHQTMPNKSKPGAVNQRLHQKGGNNWDLGTGDLIPTWWHQLLGSPWPTFPWIHVAGVINTRNRQVNFCLLTCSSNVYTRYCYKWLFAPGQGVTCAGNSAGR